MRWNPDYPKVFGLQAAAACRAGQQPGVVVGSSAGGVAQFFESTVAESVARSHRYWAGQSPSAIIMCEHLKAGHEIAVNKVTTVLRPTSSAQTGDLTWENQASSTTGATLYQSVDEATLDTSDFIHTLLRPNGFAGRVSFGFAGAAGILSGKRILAVRICMQGKIEPVQPSTGAISELDGAVSGATFSRRVGLFPVDSIGPGTMYAGETNPLTGFSWTVAEVQGFATGTPISLIPLNPYPEGQNDLITIYQLWVEIDSCDENRYMRDVAENIGPGNHWDSGVAQIPTNGSSPWAKGASDDYTVLVRTIIYGDQAPSYVSGQRISVPYLPFIEPPTPIRDGLIAVYPTVVLAGDGTVTSMGDPVDDRAFGMSIGPGVFASPDSQTYTDVDEVTFSGPNGAAQTFTAPGASAFDVIRFAAAIDETGGMVSDLTFVLTRVSDAAVIGSGSFTRAEFETFTVEPHRRFWRMCQALFDSPVFLAGVQYRLTFSTAGPGSWVLQNLTTMLDGQQADGDATFNGTTDVAYVGGVADRHGDLACVMAESPGALTGFDATPAIVPIEFPDGVCGPAVTGRAYGDGYYGSGFYGDDEIGSCVIDGLPGVLIGWDPVEDDGYFGYYEIQRQDPSTDWATIYRSDGLVLAFTDVYLDEYEDLYDGGYGPGGGISASHIYDWEGRIGVESCYRIRQVNRLGVASVWSDVKCATRPDVGIGYIFTSNTADPLKFVAYPDQYQAGPAVRSFAFPEADEVTYRRLYGRNNYIALRPTERRGVKFDRSLNVAFLMTPNGPQWLAFDALRDLAANTDLPYVAVCDESGGRVFASITVPDGQITNDEAYTATVRIVQTADLPTP